jgi:hypothetical protein
MTVAELPAGASVHRWRDHRFFFWMSVAVLLVVVVGFARSFYLRHWFPEWPSPQEPFFLLHGVVYTAWFLLMPVQSALIDAGRVRAHRALGVFGVLLATGVFVFGLMGAVIAARRPGGFFGVPIPGDHFLIIPTADMLIFAVLVACAVARRNRPQSHKRLMLLASISLLTAPFARWPGVYGSGVLVYFLLNDLMLVPLVIWDRRRLGHVHAATWWAGGIPVLLQPVQLALSGTPFWLGIAHWMTGIGR